MRPSPKYIGVFALVGLTVVSCGDDDNGDASSATEDAAVSSVTDPAVDSTMPSESTEAPGSTVASVDAAATTAATEATAGDGAEPVGVAALLPCAVNDLNFCQQAFTALTRLEGEGAITLTYLENAPIDEAAAEQALRQYAEDGNQLVIGHSSVYVDVAARIGPDYPDTMFAVVGAPSASENVSSYDPGLWEGAYLAGIAAASITETRVIGGVAAFDVPLCHAMMVSFEMGAQSVDPAIEALVTYTGDFSDPAPAREAALAQIDGGADVFVICGSGPSEGVIPAAAERDVSAFGYVGDQSALAPENVAGSIIWDMYPSFVDMVERVGTGDVTGKVYLSSVSDDTISLQLNPKYQVAEVPQETIDALENTTAQVTSGELEIEFIPE